MGVLKDAINKTSPESKQFVKKNLDISEEVIRVLKATGLTQKELAEKLGKQPSEISKWLTGLHNLTLKSITSMEVALGTDIITVPSKIKHTQKSIKYIVHNNRVRKLEDIGDDTFDEVQTPPNSTYEPLEAA